MKLRDLLPPAPHTELLGSFSRSANTSLLLRGIGVDFGDGVKCVERAGGIDDGRAGIDRDRHAQQFGDLFLGRAPLLGRRGMHRDAAVAAQRNGDRERYEFARLFIEVTGLLAGVAQGGVALDDIGVELAETADPSNELLCRYVFQSGMCMTVSSSMRC